MAALKLINLFSRTFSLIFHRGFWQAIEKYLSALETAARHGHIPDIHYSQDGEDCSLIELLPRTGYYVDVGAHHPERFSVTKKLYEQGWQGINIDWNEPIISDFRLRRPRDLSIKALVGTPSEVSFYRYKDAALDTLSSSRADYLMGLGHYPAREEKCKVVALGELLQRLESPSYIDFLNVDVEGTELDVLRSIDLEAYRIGAILVEIGRPAWSVVDDELSKFLSGFGFKPVLVFLRSVLFLPESHPGNQLFRSV